MELPNLENNDFINSLTGKIIYPLNKEHWGPTFWGYLHSITANYPNTPKHTDKVEMQSSLYHFVKNIPCIEPCRNSAVSYIRTNPPNLESKEKLFKWGTDFHNFVNQKLGKSKKDVILRNDPDIEAELTIKRRNLNMDQLYTGGNNSGGNTLPQPQNELDSRLAKSFPRYESSLNSNVSIDEMAQSLAQQDMMMNVQPEINRENLLSGFESTLEPLGGALGLKAVDINLIVTPALLLGIVQNITTANLTPLGNLTTSLLASILLIGSGAVMKDGIPYGDRILMQTIGFGYLGYAIMNLNQKAKDKIMEDGNRTVEAIMNWGKEGSDPLKTLYECFIETPNMKNEKEKPMLAGLEATLMDGSFATADIRGSQMDSQSLYDMGTSGNIIGRNSSYPTSGSPLSITKTVASERNTLSPFIDNVKQISMDQSQLDSIPVPTYIMPKSRY